jgi:iron complex outermembrane receptor protein
MEFQHSLMAGAVLSVLAGISSTASAQSDDKTAAPVVVTATPFGAGEGAQILAPARVLSGDELRNKLGNSIGDTLAHEPGVSASGFGTAASRPVIRGLEGPRVKILQNGMSIFDVSSLSNDHAVAAESSTARQIEILRGPAALLYGSGAIGGLVNVVNERIPVDLAPRASGEAEFRLGTVDRSRSMMLSAEGSAGSIGLHVDGNLRRADDYRIPVGRTVNDPASAAGSLPWSSTREGSLGFGAAHIGSWGHVGAAVGYHGNRYGAPTLGGSQIDQVQTRLDFDALIKQPLEGFRDLHIKLGHTDYRHDELDAAAAPQVRFRNRALETRIEMSHVEWAGWRGTFGLQAENTRYSALSASGGPNTVPPTRSATLAAFLVEERDIGALKVNLGARLESVRYRPDGAAERNFGLNSWSAGGLWAFAPAYALGATFSLAQRAPAMEELYSSGPHESTGTFDRGNPAFIKETSRNIELSLQKTDGMLRWKGNLFHNRVHDFIHGRMTGVQLDDAGNPGTELNERIYTQGNATIQGAEAEISYNWRGDGWSARGFADTSRGTLDGAGNLPLQPATRFGVEGGWKQGPWRAGLTLVRALSQDRLAATETATPGYSLLDGSLSYSHRYGKANLTWFVLGKNLLNQEIRLSTSVLKDVAPQPGRSVIVGVRARF